VPRAHFVRLQLILIICAGCFPVLIGSAVTERDGKDRSLFLTHDLRLPEREERSAVNFRRRARCLQHINSIH
jgi:hypothetical protein